MSDAIYLNKGECLGVQGTWTDEDGVPINLTGKTLSISESRPSSLLAGTVAALVAADGTFTIHVDADVIDGLPLGRLSWIRLSLSDGGGCPDTTPPIWINLE